VQNGPGPFNGFVRTLDDARAEFAAAWGAWLKAAGLNEDTPTAQQLKDSRTPGPVTRFVMVPMSDGEQTRLLDWVKMVQR
jgi:hypothetical protein